jgi:hypothetical protein
MPTENRSSSNHATRTFTLDSLTTALEQVQALHEISADLIAENVFGQPAQQGRGEPVAWLNTATGAVTASPVQVMDWDDESEPVKGLYTHADPTDVAQLELEIEQLRFSLTMNDCASVEDDCVRDENRELRAQLAEAQQKHRDELGKRLVGEVKLEAKLAEAQALLRAWLDIDLGKSSPAINDLRRKTDYLVSASAEPSAPVEPLIPGHRLEAIDELLADADPQSDAVDVPASELRDLVSAVRSFQVRALTDGAPVEIDERAEFEQACRHAAIARGREFDPEALRRRADGSHVNPLTECGWWGWRARAALERKP